MHLNLITLLAITILIAFVIKRISHKIGIPIVTGYVLIGVVLGISMLRLFSIDVLNKFSIVNDFALGLIGFTIGSELRKDVFKNLGRSILFIALFESLGAFILVAGTLMLLLPSKLYLALLLGAVASATAPAATVYVIQQYKAKGPLTSTILAVVGIDDALALMIFVFASVLAKSMLNATHIHLSSLFLTPLLEISLSLCLGILFGLIFWWFFRKVRYPDDMSLGILSAILFQMGLADQFGLSGLLSVMAFGSTVTNLNAMLTNRSVKILEGFSPVLFACFFIFGGAHLDLTLIPKIGVIGLVYLVARVTGKIGGASLGALLGRAPKSVRKYIGFTLIPQVGVAVALALMVQKEFGSGDYGEQGIEMASVVINVLLFTTIITEILGPLLTKWALTRVGERGDGYN